VQELFETIDDTHARHTVVYSDARIGLRALLVIDDATLGPAVGGVRTQPYPSLAHALQDAAWLSRAMTDKCALAGLDAGGGKLVVVEHPDMNRDAVFDALGERLADLRGAFWTGPDLGTTHDDLERMARHTSHVHADKEGVAESVALGVLRSMQGILDVDNRKTLDGLRVGVLGAGRVGTEVARLLKGHGVELLLADVDDERARAVGTEVGATVMTPSALFDETLDVFCPCATGGVLSERRAQSMKVWAVCGGGNNLLANMKAADILDERGVWMVPDILSSAGGVIYGVGKDLMKLDDRTPLIDALRTQSASVLQEAKSRGSNTLIEARRRARERIQHRRDATD